MTAPGRLQRLVRRRLALSGLDRTQALRPHGQFVNPQRLFVREQSRPKVRNQQELVELHLREIGGAQDDIGLVDHQLAVEPAPHDAVGVRSVRVQVEAVELEHGLDTVPTLIVEENLFAVVELAVVTAPERALGESVGLVLVLNVLGRQAQLAIPRLDVDGEVAGSRPAKLFVLGGHEVHQVGVIGTTGPSPTLGQLDVKAQIDGVGRFKEMANPRRTGRVRGTGFPEVLDAPLAGIGLFRGDGELVSVIPISLEQAGIVKALAKKDSRWFFGQLRCGR